MSTLMQAQVALKEGAFARAERLLDEHLARHADDAIALSMLGYLYWVRREPDRSRALLERSVRGNERIPLAWRLLAHACLAQGDFKSAAGAAESAHLLDANDVEALCLRAACAIAVGDFDAAAVFRGSAQSRSPGTAARAFHVVANTCFDHGHPGVAEALYHIATTIDPRTVEAWINLGLSRYRLGRADTALQAMQAAYALDPSHRKALRWTARLLDETSADVNARLTAWRQVAADDPRFAPGQFRLAYALRDSGQHEEAHEALARAAALDPDLLAARFASAVLPHHAVFENQAQREQFLAQFRQGLDWLESLDPDDPAVRAQAERLLLADTDFHVNYLGHALLDEHRRYGAALTRLATTLAPRPGAVAPARAGTRRRIGVVSAHLHRHSVSKLFRHALMALADDQSLELVLFPLQVRDDPWLEAWRGRARIEGGGTGPADWIAQIRAAQPDVLVYTDYGMECLQQALTPLRLAPVQALLWGHPVTSGLDSIDYFISSDAMEPDDGQSHYSETLHRLPGLGCMFDPDDIAAIRVPPVSLPPIRGPRLYCAQSFYKLHPGHDALFAGILAALPDAELVLTPNAGEHVVTRLGARLRAACAEVGVDFERRCRILDRLDEGGVQSVIAGSDLLLDSLDWSGGITSLEAFWQNKPVLTLPGPLMRGRHTAAMLKLMGIDDLLAGDCSDYLRIAVELGSNRARLAELSDTIRERKHVLYRDTRVAEALTEFLRTTAPG